MIKEPRLRFTEEERADPALEKPIRKAEKAAAKADKAQAKIPKKQVKRAEVDPKTGKVTTKLVLEDKPRPPSKLSHTVRDAPGNAVAGKLHQEIRETEDDNVGVESAHKSEEAVETGVHLVREGYRSHKLKPYRKAAQAERKLEKTNIEALFQKSVYENPAAASNPLSRWQQKQQIKKGQASHIGQKGKNTPRKGYGSTPLEADGIQLLPGGQQTAHRPGQSKSNHAARCVNDQVIHIKQAVAARIDKIQTAELGQLEKQR